MEKVEQIIKNMKQLNDKMDDPHINYYQREEIEKVKGMAITELHEAVKTLMMQQNDDYVEIIATLKQKLSELQKFNQLRSIFSKFKYKL